MGDLIQEGMKAGWLLGTEGCLPSSMGARVRQDGDKVSVTDGPFTESKEMVGGFAILKADSKQAAIELAKHFLSVVGQGECELRQLCEQGADCVGSAKGADARRQTAKKLDGPSGGSPDTVPVLREFSNTADHSDVALMA
jgi:hypothetical protein